MDTAPIVKPEWVPSAYAGKEEAIHKASSPVPSQQPAIRQLTEKPVQKTIRRSKRK